MEIRKRRVMIISTMNKTLLTDGIFRVLVNLKDWAGQLKSKRKKSKRQKNREKRKKQR